MRDIDRQLFDATEKGDAALVRRLLDEGANVGARWDYRRKKIELDNDSPPDLKAVWLARDNIDDTALLLAARLEHVNVVAALLDAGADPNASSGGPCVEETALTLAAWRKCVPILRLLLDKGAAVNVADGWGDTPLICAASTGDEESVLLLLERGADIHATDELGANVLLRAAGGGNIAVITLLEELGLPLESVDEIGRTAVMHAATHGHAHVLRFLVERGLPTNAVDEYGTTVLMHAASALSGGSDAARFLIEECGADIHARDELYGATALMHAAASGNTEVVRILLEHGANPNATNHKGKTLFSIATEDGNEDILAVLRAAGVGK